MSIFGLENWYNRTRVIPNGLILPERRDLFVATGNLTSQIMQESAMRSKATGQLEQIYFPADPDQEVQNHIGEWQDLLTSLENSDAPSTWEIDRRTAEEMTNLHIVSANFASPVIQTNIKTVPRYNDPSITNNGYYSREDNRIPSIFYGTPMYPEDFYERFTFTVLVRCRGNSQSKAGALIELFDADAVKQFQYPILIQEGGTSWQEIRMTGQWNKSEMAGSNNILTKISSADDYEFIDVDYMITAMPRLNRPYKNFLAALTGGGGPAAAGK